jgi:hypothetical protein
MISGMKRSNLFNLIAFGGGRIASGLEKIVKVIEDSCSWSFLVLVEFNSLRYGSMGYKVFFV